MSSSRKGITTVLSRTRLKISPHLILYFSRGILVCENYLTRQSFVASPATCEILSAFQKWRTVSQAIRTLPQYTDESILESVRNLIDHGLIIDSQSEQYMVEKKLANQWLWPIASRYYHFSTKIGESFSTSAEIRRYYERYLEGQRQPPIYKSYPKQSRVRLPSPSGTEAPLFATLRRRISTREFTGAAISLKQFSRIIYYTWGRISTYKTKEFGDLLHKTSPSAGARHPIEVYPIINKVSGLKPGIYHYSVRNHSLELLRRGDFREKCVAFTAGQSWTRNVSVLFIMTGVVARTAWKYRSARVYRALLLDAGHLSQTFLLASTALRLGAFCLGIISDSTIEKELGLDGITEVALFAVGAGRAA